jgi:phage tail-like protein
VLANSHAFAQKATPSIPSPLSTFSFGIEASGQLVGYFTECTGMGSATEIILLNSPADPHPEFPEKYAGRLTIKNITCKRLITHDLTLWMWRKQVEDRDMSLARRTGFITLLDQSFNPIARWSFQNGWPASLFVPDDEANSETLVLAVESIIRVP